MAGRLTDTDVEVVQETGQSGRVVDTDLEVIQPADTNGRLSVVEVDVVQPDNSVIDGTIAMGPGGWGFIPIGSYVSRSTYPTTYRETY